MSLRIGSSFTPLTFGPALWLSDTGASAGTWPDISGNGRDATQATTSAQPQIVTNGLNGRQVRRFNPEGKWLVGASWQMPTITTMFCVFKCASDVLTRVIYEHSSNININEYTAYIGIGPNVNTILFGCKLGGTNYSFADFSGASFSQQSYNIISAINNTTHASSEVRNGGVAMSKASRSGQTSAGSGTSASLPFYIGARGGTERFFHGDIAEIIIYPRALNPVERQQVERYLATKWAIPVTSSLSPAVRVSNRYQGLFTTDYAKYKYIVDETVKLNSTTNPANDTTSTPSGTYPGSNAFVGGVLLPDGRVFCVPFSSTSARIYDPATNTLTTPSGTYPGVGAFIGGVLLPNGRVFCVPHSATFARIYDPATNTLTIPSGSYPGSNAFVGGVLLPDGRVFCVPFSSTSARIYDPATNTLTTPSGSYPGSNAFAGGVLLPDGRVFCVPRNSTSARIYDPATNTLTTPSGSYPAAFEGGVLLPDGRVFCVPANSTSARIYDPITDTLTTPSGSYPGSNAFTGGVLLPDGRVFCVPFNSIYARIYDPITDTLTTPSGSYPGSNAFTGGVLLPDGRVFCVPRSSTSARILSGDFSGQNRSFLSWALLSPYLNKY